MERQYIGARYVPMFANPVEWDNQRTFEPLTIVTYMGASYTSKKQVPAGIKPTDINYWACTGNYNAQVQEYREAVDGVIEKINKLPVADESRWLTVGGKGCNFTTINGAIEYAKQYATQSKRVTIFITSGLYGEEITLLNNPGIDLYGVGRVVVQTTSLYPNSPLLVGGTTNINNINFVCVGSSNPSYACHIEAQLDNTPGTITFRNCEFTATKHHGVGIGLGGGYTVDFYSCRFISNNGAGLYCHNYPYETAKTQILRCYDCSFYGMVGTDIILENVKAIQGNPGNSSSVFSFAGCSGTHNKVRYVNSEGEFAYFKGDTNMHLDGISTNTIAGVDYFKRSIKLGGFLPCSNGGYFNVPFENSNSYTPTITKANKASDSTNILSNIEYIGVGDGVYKYKWNGGTTGELIDVTVIANPK